MTKMVIKRKDLDLFYHHKGGWWLHYDQAERFDTEDVDKIWLPVEWHNGKRIEVGEWIIDDAWLRLQIKLGDLFDATMDQVEWHAKVIWMNLQTLLLKVLGKKR